MQKAKTEGEEEKEEMNGHGKSQSLLLMLHRAPLHSGKALKIGHTD